MSVIARLATAVLSLAGCGVVRAQCDAGAWLPGPPPPGTDGSVNAMLAWDPDGAGAQGPVLVVGGNFNLAGVPAGNLAMWDGSAWSAFSDVSGRVSSLCEFNGDLIVGGQFSMAGPVAAKNVARWNGSAWTAMGSGLGTLSYVYALAVYHGELFAGGSFPGGIARWTGTTWTGIGASIGGGTGTTAVYALTVYNDELVFAGNFSTINTSTPAPRIMAWNGSTLHTFGTGIGGGTGVHAMCVHGGELYAAGSFTSAGGSPASGIARWDGAAWYALGSGISGGYEVRALAFYAGKLVACGAYSTAGGMPAKGIALWDGAAWEVPAEFGVSNFDAAAIYGGELYVGDVLRWDGATVRPVGPGFDGAVRCFAEHDGNFYTGGDFVQAIDTAAAKVARWNGAGWDAVGGGLGVGRSEGVYALQSYAGELYAGGTITKAEGAPVNNMARWDGAAWQAVGSGITATSGAPSVRAMAEFGGELIVSGYFTHAGGAAAACVAAWNGVSWHAMGSGLPASQASPVSTLAVYNGSLYAAGLFTVSGGTPVHNVARWDGAAWQAVGGGVWGSGGFGHTGQVNAMLAWDGKLYVGGYLDFAGGNPVTGLAAWNGTAWTSGGSFNDRPVYSLADYRGDLIVSGFFSSAGGTSVANIARFNGVSWVALGAGTYSTGGYLGVLGDDLFTGSITQAGDQVSWYLGHWQDVVAPVITVQPFDVSTCTGGTAAFTVGATGTFLVYQWRKDGNDLSDGGHVSGAHAAELVITDAAAEDIGSYDCVVSNECDLATSAAAVLNVCFSDFDCNGFVNGEDFDAFVWEFYWGNAAADVDHNGFVNGDDFDSFTVAFVAGC